MEAESDSGRLKRIAIIDDDLRLAQLVKTVLEEANRAHRVYVDGNVVRAYDFVDRIRPDLVILDIMMGVDPVGFQTLDRLTATPELSHIPVVISSAGMFPEERYKSFTSPLVFLPKPFQLTELVAAVDRALDTAARIA
jgi:DNA-binding response OmpR family regulator